MNELAKFIDMIPELKLKSGLNSACKGIDCDIKWKINMSKFKMILDREINRQKKLEQSGK